MQDEELGQIKDRLGHGKFEEALQLLQTLEQRENLPPEDQVAYLLLKSQILREKFVIEKALEAAEEAFRISQDLGNPLILVDAIISKAEALRCAGALAGASDRFKSSDNLQLINHGEDILDNLTNIEAREITRRAALLQRYKGMVYRALGEIDRSLQCFHRSFALHEELGNRDEMIQVLWSSATTYAVDEDHDHQLEKLWKILELHEEMDNKEGKAEILLEIANAYQAKGEPALALEQIQKSQALAETLPKTGQVGWVFSNIGEFYGLQRGDWKSLLDANQKALPIFEELGIKLGLGKCLARISQYHWVKEGEFGIGLEYAEKALAAFEEFGEKPPLAGPIITLAGFT